jgi:type II secretory pathway component PulF
MEFHYTAYAPDRGVFKGTIDAPDKPEAEAALATLGHTVLKMVRSRERPGLELLFPSFFNVKPKDLISFSRQIAAMLGSGGSLMRALEMAQSEARSRLMRRTVMEMRETLAGGESLSQAMEPIQRSSTSCSSALYRSVSTPEGSAPRSISLPTSWRPTAKRSRRP